MVQANSLKRKADSSQDDDREEFKKILKGITFEDSIEILDEPSPAQQLQKQKPATEDVVDLTHLECLATPMLKINEDIIDLSDEEICATKKEIGYEAAASSTSLDQNSGELDFVTFSSLIHFFLISNSNFH